MKQQTLVIGIAGGSGSGKSTLAAQIAKALGEEAAVLCHDFYYKNNDHLSFEERVKQNYDHPNAFDNDMMVEDLQNLKAGKEIYHPVYSFSEHTRMAEKKLLKPSRIILVDGILIFAHQPLIDLMDIKVFVDTDADIRLIRRLLRDVRERGRDLSSVINQYMSTVKPMHEQFVEPSKKNADIIIPEGGHNQVALSMLLGRVREFISAQA